MKAKSLFFLVVILFGFNSVGYPQVMEYPNKPIQIIEGHPPGGGIDIFYRLLSEELSKTWKVPVNILNKPAAVGAVAASEVANAEKDGYTFLAILLGQLAAMSVANPKSPVHLLRDFDPVEVNTYAAQLLVTRSDSKFNSLEEVVAYARQKPGEVLCGTTQLGSNFHLLALLFNRLAKINITILPVEGSQIVMTNVLGGHFDLGTTNDVLARPQVAAGKIKVLVSDIKSTLPIPVPTFAEKGYPEVDLVISMTLLGPKGLPPAILKTWENTLETIMKDPKFQASLNKLGFTVSMITGTERLNKRLKEEIDKYSRFTPEELGWKR
jgi:tripartite-type tricarboxylate transporter receptor subunit TctC